MTGREEAIAKAKALMGDRDKVKTDISKNAIDRAVSDILNPYGLTWDIVKDQKKHGLAILLVDESGSMQTRYDDTVNGVNSFIKEWGDNGDVFPFVSLLTFDLPEDISRGAVRALADNVPAKSAPLLGPSNYKPRGMTPLYDAILAAIESGDRAREKNPEITITVVIQTDGMENASRRASLGGLKEMIAAREANGWQFIFLGADLGRATYTQANNLGIAAQSSVAYASGRSVDTYSILAAASAQFTNTRAKSTFSDKDREKMGENTGKPS